MMLRRLTLLRLASTTSSLVSVQPSLPPSSAAFIPTVQHWLDQKSIPWQPVKTSSSETVLQVGGSLSPACPFLLHMIPSPTNSDAVIPPSLCRDMTDSTTTMDVVHLHQDMWQSKTRIVKSRLANKAGQQGRRIFARKTTLHRIPNDVARQFFTDHHLWGATKAKYIYGLFCSSDTDGAKELVAAASFSSGRTIVRDGVPCQSHELLRFCTQRDTTIVGGLSKLVKAFVREQQPDDIVTQIDRDWGDGSGWCQLGFSHVAVMPPLIMAIGLEDGLRRHLVGAGIQIPSAVNGTDSPSDSMEPAMLARLGLPLHVLDGLSQVSDAETALEFLLSNGFAPIYDSGVERLCMLVPASTAAQAFLDKHGREQMDGELVRKIWDASVPKYPCEYYSPNDGIRLLLDHARGNQPKS